jgi:hypothetical protein
VLIASLPATAAAADCTVRECTDRPTQLTKDRVGLLRVSGLKQGGNRRALVVGSWGPRTEGWWQWWTADCRLWTGPSGKPRCIGVWGRGRMEPHGAACHSAPPVYPSCMHLPGAGVPTQGTSHSGGTHSASRMSNVECGATQGRNVYYQAPSLRLKSLERSQAWGWDVPP